MNKSLLFNASVHRILVDFVDPGAEPTTVAATLQTCTAGVHQTGLTTQGGACF